MKALLTVFAIVATLAAKAQADSVVSHVYIYNDIPVQKDSSRERKQLAEGPTSLLHMLEMHVTTIDPGKAAHPPHTHPDMEELIIVKEGTLRVTIAGKSKVLNAGGVSLALPGDEHGAVNVGKTKAVYYILKFKTRSAIDASRGQQAGGSFMTDWSEATPKKTDRGERRDVVNRSTTLFGKFDVHITTLNQGQISHPPHTHRQEEIILVKEGHVQMTIGDTLQKANAGDLVFVASGIPHNASNIGTGTCTYYAIQWE